MGAQVSQVDLQADEIDELAQEFNSAQRGRRAGVLLRDLTIAARAPSDAQGGPTPLQALPEARPRAPWRDLEG